MVLGQYNLVLFGIKWYWVNKGLLCLYILKKLMVTSTNRPTDRVNIGQSAFFKSYKIEKRQRFAIKSIGAEKDWNPNPVSDIWQMVVSPFCLSKRNWYNRTLRKICIEILRLCGNFLSYHYIEISQILNVWTFLFPRRWSSNLHQLVESQMGYFLTWHSFCPQWLRLVEIARFNLMQI